MKDFVLSTNSTVDMPKEWLDENNISIMPITYTLEGVIYKDYDGKITPKEFFDKLRAGAMPTTSQVNPEEAKESLKPLLEDGNDVLHLSFSSGLSGTHNMICLAVEELKEEYPDAKIYVIDSLCASMGGGLLLKKMLKLKNEGKTIEEVAKWAEDNKLKVCHFVVADDLDHLHRGGRVSKTAATVGGLVKIKPLLHMDDEGGLKPIGKERGRKKALNKAVDLLAERMKGVENDEVMVTHGDCLEDAEYVKQLIQEKTGVSNVLINPLGSVIGSHTGAGLIAVFAMGDKR